MEYSSFDELSELYYKAEEKEENFQEALDILEKGVKLLPEQEVEKHLFTIMMDKCYFAYNCKRYEEVISTLENMIEKGFVCPLSWFDNLKQHAKYIEIKEKNQLLLIDTQKNTKFQYSVYVPEGYTKEKKYPIFFNLHGDGENAEEHKKYWKPDLFLSKGFIVVYPQSSQVIRHHSYAWINNHLFDDEIDGVDCKPRETYNSLYDDFKACYDEVSKQYSIDEEQIIIGGFSGGAMGTIDITLSKIIPVRGTIALCSVKPKTFTEEKVKGTIQRGLKWVFMDGEKDVPVQEVEEMMEILKKLDVPYEYYINEGIGHWYPEDLDSKLEKALSFILE